MTVELKCAYDPRIKKESSWTFNKDKFVDISKDDLPKESDMTGAYSDAYDALLDSNS